MTCDVVILLSYLLLKKCGIMQFREAKSCNWREEYPE